MTDSTDSGAPEGGAAADAALGAAIRARMRHGDLQRIAEAVGHDRSTVRYWLKGAHPIREAALAAIAAVLGTTPATLREEAGAGAEPLDEPHNGVSPAGPAALLSAHGYARYYPGYPLWARENPRTEAARAAALRPGRRVMCEPEDALPPESVDVVRVDDPGPLRIATAQGVVGVGWRLFVDRTRAAAAVPGELVAALTRRGDLTELAVGELGRDAAGGWTLRVGRVRRPIDRADVLGVVRKYQAPPAQYGWVLEDDAPDPGPPAAGGA